jgi:hypothetical protein
MRLPRAPLAPLAGLAGLVIVVAIVVAASTGHRALLGGDAGPSAAPEALVARMSAPARTGLPRVEVPFAPKAPTQPAEGAPPGWTLQEFTGQADVEVQRLDGRFTLRLRSTGSSFAVYRDVLVDLNELPVLAWTWKALRLPSGGDVRVAARDDQAAQVYVVFPRWPSPLTNSDVIGYIWDTTAPLGARLTSPRAGNVKLVVVESGSENVGRWRSYERDVVKDYVALFGRKPPRVGKIAVMIDSNDTRSGAEALFAGLAFEQRR